MTESKQSFQSKKANLTELANRAKKQTNVLCGTDLPTDKSRNEKAVLEGDQGTDERLIDELKSAVEELTTAVESVDTRAKELENQLKEQHIKMRSKYASKAYRFVWLWSIALIVILLLEGLKTPIIKIWHWDINIPAFDLDPKILIALISGVTVNIVAVFVVVIRNLFPSDAKEKDEKKKAKPKK